MGESATDRFKNIEIHGFVSQGYMKTTDNNYLGVTKGLGSFGFTEVGLNFTKSFTDELRTGIQLYARQLGSTGSFNTNFRWFYLDYHPSDRFGFRFGRIKIPFGLYNEINDIDAARAAILLPQSIYPAESLDYLLAQNGFEGYGYTGTGPWGSLEYRLYAGTIAFPAVNTPAYPIQQTAGNVPFIVGTRLMWGTPIDGLRVGVSGQAVRLDTTLKLGTTTPVSVSFQFPVNMLIGSAEYIHGDLSLAAEYSRWFAQFGNSTNTAIIPNFSVTNERGYIMGAYRLARWFEPCLYYSMTYPNVDSREGIQNYQHDVSATLRFDINQFWLLKTEAHYMIGTAALQSGLTGPGLNDGVPTASLAPNWWTFLVKTTGYF
ncbi:MAG: hypothetical protein ABIQ95_09180 [Bdellovibrionia bacterium]